MSLAVGVPVVLFALAAVLILAGFFIACEWYEEGLVGNAALGGAALACALLLWDFVRGRLELPSPTWCLLIVCLALFILRHAWRFAMFRWHPRIDWLRKRTWLRPRDVDDTIPFPWPFGKVR